MDKVRATGSGNADEQADKEFPNEHGVLGRLHARHQRLSYQNGGGGSIPRFRMFSMGGRPNAAITLWPCAEF
ncbi:hypothetical protein SBV1_3030012 [Verrucomicrobia bacterium]|nr:hypothetical protein SBV1_3030012 [Verrucomicrobiota bacterium]